MIKSWHDKAWEEYIEWNKENKKVVKKINELIKDIERNGNTGIGHPEPLVGNMSGYWSRHITDGNRLVYKIDGEHLYIISCKTHYYDK